MKIYMAGNGATPSSVFLYKRKANRLFSYYVLQIRNVSFEAFKQATGKK